MASLKFCLAVIVIFFASECRSTIENHCTDISFFDVVQYMSTPKRCCDTELVHQCTKKTENVCADVLEMKCDVIGWADCVATPTTTQGKKCVVDYKDFDYKDCKEVETLTKHVKKVPECKTVTKNNCVTDWDVDEDGNKVWSGTETCTPVSWEECEIVEKEVDFPSVETECDTVTQIKWTDYMEKNVNVLGLDSVCELKTAVDCTDVMVNKCTTAEWEECTMTPHEICETEMIHKPEQEKVHQKKCLTD